MPCAALDDDEAVRLLHHQADEAGGRLQAVASQRRHDVVLRLDDRERAHRLVAVLESRCLPWSLPVPAAPCTGLAPLPCLYPVTPPCRWRHAAAAQMKGQRATALDTTALSVRLDA